MKILTFEQYIKEWLETLEDPECPYQQAEGRLGNRDGACCLGVANLLFEFEEDSGGGVLELGHADLLHFTKLVTFEEGAIIHPERLSNHWSRQDALAWLNDSGIWSKIWASKIAASTLSHRRGLTFPQIAQLVRYLGWDKE